MQLRTITTLDKELKDMLLKLWNKEYPNSIANSSIENLNAYLHKLENPLHVLLISDEALLAWFCEFDRDGERNFAMIVENNSQGKGLGTKLLQDAKQRNTALNGWVVQGNDYKKSDGSLYPSPIAFYEKNGFEILTDQIWETDVLKTVKIRWVYKEKIK
jgi:GNAT superfamily N-acetyltransferase